MQTETASMPGVLWAYLFWGLFVGAPLATVSIVGAFIAQGQIAIIATLPRDGGPAAFEGPLARAIGPRRTPMGLEVAAWSGVLVSSVQHGKSSTRTVLCTLGELDELTLRGRALAIDPSATPVDGPFDLLSSSRLRIHPSALLGEIETTEQLPAEVLARCPTKPPVERETRTWREHRFPAGDTVTFLGCRDGDRLVACAGGGPGNGALFHGDRRALVGRLLATSLGMTAGMLAISLFFAVVATISTLVHLRPRLQEKRA
jgi:hypothetical protein